MRPGRPSAVNLRLRAELLARARRFVQCGKRLRRAADPDTIHDARVAARRFREALGLLHAPARPLHGMARMTHRALRALRRARDTDVALAWFSGLRPRGAAERAAIVDMLRRLRLRRARCRVQVRAAAKRWPREPGHAFKPAIASRNFGTALGVARHQVALRLAEATARRAHLAGPADLDGLHAFRIAVKHLRYAAEMLDAARGRKFSRRVGRLRRLQDALGALNDLRTFRERAQKRTRKLAKFASPSRLGEGYPALVKRIEARLGRALQAAMPLVCASGRAGGWRDFREAEVSSRRGRR